VRNAGAPDAAIFFKWALCSHGPDANAPSVSLEEQFIAGANPQRAPNLVRDSDLSLACDARRLLRDRFSIPYCIILLLTYGSAKTGLSSIVVFLIELAPLRTMASRFTWFEPHSNGVAHERGASEFVSHAWSELERWVTCIDLPKPLPVILNLGPIVREAAKRPELRQLRPDTSLFTLGFSRTTGYPFPRDCPHAEPIGNDLYRVTSADGSILFDGVDAVQAVDALVAALPPNYGPAIDGTAEDM
jgi:Family of unknown function (DUF6193)